MCLDRNAQVLRYILEAAPGIGHTKLAKFTYLADLEARKLLGVPISQFEYIKDQYGPFDKERFFGALETLKGADFITENVVQCGDYPGFQMCPTHKAVEYEFTLAETEVLGYIARTYLSKSTRELCDDIVYKTEPMIDARLGDPLPMDRVTRKPVGRHAFNLERMLAGEASTKAGRVRSWGEVLHELQARYLA